MKRKYKYCYILDFDSTGVFCLELENAEKKPEDFKTEEELITYWGFKPSNCSWLLTDEDLDIIVIHKPLKLN